ncbi:cytochrome c3 family protein [Xanthobacteraceae bacterium Astr-EGSB]|uniref:cytochrome c3 family protein n=1 Tax=Astrobacterium formosum TaxID=3069710 RepID=UPI0027AE6665|nr:cytochrome c3 family protein [Xanthobacteraceae bacterium Astr-EGSB]
MRASLVALSLLIVGAGVFLSGGSIVAQDLRGKHRDQALTCIGCHETDSPTKTASSSICRTCHATVDVRTRALNLGGKTYAFNPHASHQGDLRCTLCHKVHKPSVLICKDCHAFEVVVP